MDKMLSWQVVKETLQTITPLIALFIGWQGLSTWRKQLKGSHDFELSRRLLLSVYRCRDALQAARNPFVQPGEASKERTDWEESAYENRWNDVVKAFSEIQAAKLEAEVSWDEAFNQEMKDLRRLISTLMMAIKHYLSSRQSVTGSRLFTEKDEKILYGDTGDDYDKQLEKVIAAFEKKIKPKLKN
jgi:hypothetical protein